MSAPEASDEAQLLIIIRGARQAKFEAVAAAIGRARGRILRAAAPIGVVASVPRSAIELLRAAPLIESVDTDVVSEQRRKSAYPPVAELIDGWNAHVHRREARRRRETDPAV